MPGKLAKYQSMRDFDLTPEPRGARDSASRKKPIFVVQKHAASHLHYDFRLEIEGVLKSWAVPKGPSYDPSTKRLAMMTEDHPYEYARFEGVIPAGSYGGGNVIIWDHGTWEFIGPASTPAKAVREGQIKFRLDGLKLKGEWALIHLAGRSRKENEWLLVKHRDAYASETVDVTAQFSQSVISGKEVEEVGGENVWISNRKAAAPRTVAERLAAGTGGRAKSRKTRSGKSAAGRSSTRGSKAAAGRSAGKKVGTRSGSTSKKGGAAAKTRWRAAPKK